MIRDARTKSTGAARPFVPDTVHGGATASSVLHIYRLPESMYGRAAPGALNDDAQGGGREERTGAANGLRILVIVILAIAGVPAGAQTHVFPFEDGPEGWSADFADYPVTDSLFYEFPGDIHHFPGL